MTFFKPNCELALTQSFKKNIFIKNKKGIYL